MQLAIAAELPGQFEGLARQQAAGEAAVETLRKDVKVCTRNMTRGTPRGSGTSAVYSHAALYRRNQNYALYSTYAHMAADLS